MNKRGEKPLDLAAQYGRLQVVQMLVRANYELLNPYKNYGDKKRMIFQQTPLHLASRNGHKEVVEVLLAAGVDVNLVTENGSALHEAALTSKESVVQTLLKNGVDLNITDSNGLTALDLLKQFPATVTRGIVSVINGKYSDAVATCHWQFAAIRLKHTFLHFADYSSGEQEDILKVSTSRDCYYDEQSYHSRGIRESHAWSSYR